MNLLLYGLIGPFAVAAWGAGYVRTLTGSYFDAFAVAGTICLLAAALTPFIGMRGERAGVPVIEPALE